MHPCDDARMPKPDVEYEFSDKPAPGNAMPVAPGIYWLRMPLPFELDHINLWLYTDGDGWIVVDTGLGGTVSQEVWERILTETVQGKPVTHVVVTHMHPDHVGSAGFLCDRFGVDLWMTRDEYLLCRILVGDTGREAPEEAIEFYRAAGYDDESLAHYRKIFGSFGRMVSELPESYRRLRDGRRGQYGDHEWEVVVGRGHSPEHACFFNEELNLFVSGDQVLPSISANVSVYPTEPEANPLRDWIDSLRDIRRRIPEDVLVLPAHGKPFRGAHRRIDQLVNGHLERLESLAEFCEQPRRVVDVFSALYGARISRDNLMFATGEAIAHLHFLREEGRVSVERDKDGVDWYCRN